MDVESNQAITIVLVFGFTTVWDWLSSLIDKQLVWFWLYDTHLKSALDLALIKIVVY